MHDIHPPHSSGHGWREYFIHISIVVIGLLIALGMDQTVEYIHHRHEAQHAREMLTRELEANIKAERTLLRGLKRHDAYLYQDLVVIDHIRKHQAAAGDRIVLFFPTYPLSNAAWTTLHESGALALMSHEEIQRYGELYAIQDEFNRAVEESSRSMHFCNTMFLHGPADRFDDVHSKPIAWFNGEDDAKARLAFEDQVPGPEKFAALSPAQLDRLEQAVQEAIYLDERSMNRAHWVEIWASGGSVRR